MNSLGQKVHVRSDYEKVNGYLLILDTLSSVQTLSVSSASQKHRAKFSYSSQLIENLNESFDLIDST